MIVWRGVGFLVVLVFLASVILIDLSVNNIFVVPEGFMKYSQTHGWVIFAKLAVTGLFCWFFGKFTEKRSKENAQVIIDKESGQEIRLVQPHDLFWIPIKWWGPILLVIGIIWSLSDKKVISFF